MYLITQQHRRTDLPDKIIFIHSANTVKACQPRSPYEVGERIRECLFPILVIKSEVSYLIAHIGRMQDPFGLQQPKRIYIAGAKQIAREISPASPFLLDILDRRHTFISEANFISRLQHPVLHSPYFGGKGEMRIPIPSKGMQRLAPIDRMAGREISRSQQCVLLSFPVRGFQIEVFPLRCRKSQRIIPNPILLIQRGAVHKIISYILRGYILIGIQIITQ